MIEELISYTQRSNSGKSFFDFKRIDKLDFENFNFISDIEMRESNRIFSNKSNSINKETITELFDFIYNIYHKILETPDMLTLCFLDSNKVINGNRNLYTYDGEEFTSIPIRHEITNSSLFLQPELHEGAGVLLFLWDSSFINTITDNEPSQYRDIIMVSGFLGYLSSVYGMLQGLSGTVFAGAVQKEWDKITINSNYIPLFGYAFGRSINEYISK
ncbi:MAG: hypothetical protein K6A66_01395 [Streptococcus sp.]|uniref:hypothetical protein n=1 Tax=Streptococcus sp. TaxID=1306 RepID=UPI002583D757|nr:hypothetical protein [Streptococcus sp.]MCR5051338.1 hypothetical protein [Streptococcus sp.]